jgi:AcrR family transcriptional regulator
MNNSESHEIAAPSRPYHQVARAAATAATRLRALDAFFGLLRNRLFEDITLDEVAALAGTTRQTVIRLFGGKDGLVEAVAERISSEVIRRREVPSNATLERRIAALVKDYEVVGDGVVFVLAQERRAAELSRMLEIGRAHHRGWVTATFADALAGLSPSRRAKLIDQLYAVTDVNTWKLLRRDFGHALEAVAQLITDMARKLLRNEPKKGDRG